MVLLKSSYPRSNTRKTVGEHENVDYLAVLVNYWEWYIIPRKFIKDVRSNISVSKKGKYKDYYNNWTFE